jgi:hypothetical protein
VTAVGRRTTPDRYCIHCGVSAAPGTWYCSSCGKPVQQASPAHAPRTRAAGTDSAAPPDNQPNHELTLWRRFRQQPAWLQIVAWLLGGLWMVFFFIWSGSDLPWYGKVAAICGILAPIIAFSYALG